jgi:hypothetical protein
VLICLVYLFMVWVLGWLVLLARSCLDALAHGLAPTPSLIFDV